MAAEARVVAAMAVVMRAMVVVVRAAAAREEGAKEVGALGQEIWVEVRD